MTLIKFSKEELQLKITIKEDFLRLCPLLSQSKLSVTKIRSPVRRTPEEPKADRVPIKLNIDVRNVQPQLTCLHVYGFTHGRASSLILRIGDQITITKEFTSTQESYINELARYSEAIFYAGIQQGYVLLGCLDGSGFRTIHSQYFSYKNTDLFEYYANLKQTILALSEPYKRKVLFCSDYLCKKIQLDRFEYFKRTDINSDWKTLDISNSLDSIKLELLDAFRKELVLTEFQQVCQGIEDNLFKLVILTTNLKSEQYKKISKKIKENPNYNMNHKVRLISPDSWLSKKGILFGVRYF